VDDVPGALKLMQATLGRAGYETLCVQDGEAALRAAAEARPIAVILDLIMPGVDGFEFLERFRKMDAGRRTPVIIWTGKDLSAHTVLLLMDIQLPDVDGLQRTREFKADPDLRDIPIVAVTASAMKGDQQKTIDAGCEGYITKPIDTAQFPVEIAGYLRRGPR